VRSLIALSVMFWGLLVVTGEAQTRADVDALIRSAPRLQYGVPKNPGLTLSTIEEPIFVFNKPERLAAFVAAMEATDLPKVSPREKEVYLASLRLADTMNRNQHQKILIAVALRWQSQGMTNPIATAWYNRWSPDEYTDEQLFVPVLDKELDLLYKQVLIDQGFVAGQVDNRDVYKILH